MRFLPTKITLPLLVTWACLAGPFLPSTSAASHEVSITADGFVPAYLEVTVGDRVYWWNDDYDFFEYHSTRSYTYPWNSGPIAVGYGVYFDTTKTGTYDYVDDVGFAGFGTLVIKPVAPPPGFIPAANRVDMVYDAGRDTVYVTSGSTVLRYQLATSSFLAPFQLSGSLMGLDLSPDGNVLLVADSSSNTTNIWVHRIDLVTEQTNRVTFTRASGESGTFAVAFGGDGAALISSRFGGSGWVPLRRYDPVSGGVTTVAASIRQDSMVSASADGSTIAIVENNISSGPAHFYDVASRSIIKSGGTGRFNYECAASRDGSLSAVPTYFGTYIFNRAFNQVTNIGVYAGAHPIGAAFHPAADAVFFPFAETSYVRVYNTITWQMLAELDVQNVFGTPGNHAFTNGRMRISPDGETIFVTVSGGVRYLRHNLSLPKTRRLVVAGNPAPIGNSTPIPYGTAWHDDGTNLTIQVPAEVETGGTRYLSTGWSGSGSVPASGSGQSAAFTLLANSVLTWNWSTNQYQLTVAVSGQGTVNVTNAWYAPGAIVNLTATPASNYFFVRWLGNTPVCGATNPGISLTMDWPRALIALFAPIGGTAAALAGDWKTFGNGPAHSGYFPGGLGNALFSLRWVTNIAGKTAPLNQVAISGGKIFVTANSYLAALDEASGAPLWNYNFVSAYSVNPPTYDSGNVFVQRCDSSTTALWCFNAATGATNWVAPHSAQFERYFAPTVAEGRVWVAGGYYGGMYGFNQTNGAQLFFLDLEQYDAWDPTYYNGKLYTWIEGDFREHATETGAILSSTNLGWDWFGYDMNRTVAAADGFAYFTGSSKLYCMNLSSNRVAWQVTNSFSATPAVANGIVYGIAGSSVRAYSQAGQYLGSYTADTPLNWQPVVTDDVLIVASSSATYIFDLCTFALRQTLPVGGYLTLANGVLYVATGTGQLHAYSSLPPFKMNFSLADQGGGKQLLLRWPSVAGKSYNVWFTPNLGTSFSVIASNLAATIPFNSYQHPVTPTGKGFYRIEEK